MNESNIFSLIRKMVFTYEYVKNFVEEQGDVLLSTEYKNSTTLLDIKCNKCNEEFKQKFKNYKVRQHSYCPGKNGRRKIDIEYVKKYVEEHGDILLSTKYTTTTTLLDIKCGSCNEEYKQMFERFSKGYQHPYCPLKSNINKPVRFTYEDVKTYIEEHGDILLSTDYKNSKTLLDIKCGNCDENYKQNFNSFKQGIQHPRCPNNAKIWEKLSYDYVKEYIESEGDELISKELFTDRILDQNKLDILEVLYNNIRGDTLEKEIAKSVWFDNVEFFDYLVNNVDEKRLKGLNWMLNSTTKVRMNGIEKYDPNHTISYAKSKYISDYLYHVLSGHNTNKNLKEYFMSYQPVYNYVKNDNKLWKLAVENMDKNKLKEIQSNFGIYDYITSYFI